MDDAFLSHAYQDKAFPISAGQTISQPYTVAVQTILLNVGKRDKVLEIGTGSGYQAAILAEMGVKVYTIERQRELYRKAQVMLTSLGYRIHFFLGDGYEGQPQYGPYDGDHYNRSNGRGAGQAPQAAAGGWKTGCSPRRPRFAGDDTLHPERR